MFNIYSPVPDKVSNWSILVKPTHACNLDCKYCYDKPFRDLHGGKVMSFEMIEHILKMASEYTEEVQWIWHGGEPTIVGVEWYERVQEIFYKYPNVRVKQSMQSNGILLDERWAELSQKYDIDIGVSYDAFSQDIRLNGKTIRVEDSLDKFTSAGGRFGVITVVNKSNYKKMKEMYEYFKSRNIAPSFNHVYRSAGTVEFDLELSPDEYSDEFADFFEYWMRDNSETSTRERTNLLILSKVTGSENERLCNYSDCRYGWIGVNPAGEVYPCDRYVPERYKMGNIMDYTSIPQIYRESGGHKLYSLEAQKRFMTHCQECGYYDYCQGGCNANHIAVAGDGSGIDDFSCDLFKEEFNKLYSLLRNLDLYEEGAVWNSVFVNQVLMTPIITVKEIKNFLRSKGVEERLLNWKCSLNGKELLSSQEFKIFRIFNPFRGVTASSNHINFRAPEVSVDAKISSDFSFSSVSESRYNTLESVWKQSENELLYLMLEGNKNG